MDVLALIGDARDDLALGDAASHGTIPAFQRRFAVASGCDQSILHVVTVGVGLTVVDVFRQVSVVVILKSERLPDFSESIDTTTISGTDLESF